MLKQIKISNLLSIKDKAERSFDEKLNMFVGANASGKTTVLEIIKIVQNFVTGTLSFDEIKNSRDRLNRLNRLNKSNIGFVELTFTIQEKNINIPSDFKNNQTTPTQ